MRGRIVAQVVLAILAAGCGRHAAVDYTSPEGRYRVQFTGKPKLMEQTVPTVLGPITAKIASAEDWSGNLRRVMYADYPPGLIRLGNRDERLDGACQGMAKEAQLFISNKQAISIDGHPGRDVSFESQATRPGDKLIARARVYLVGDRLYQVFIAGRSDRLQPGSMEAFLNTFALLGPGPGPAMPGPAMPGPPGGPPPFAPPKFQRPGSTMIGPGRVVPPPTPRIRPGGPGPRSRASAPLAFYNIPEPASAPVEVDIPGMGSTPEDRSRGHRGRGRGLATESAGTASAAGASIRSFAWVDENADVVGGGDDSRAHGTRDQHLRLELDLPPNTIIESIAIDCEGGNRWVTQPSDQYGPIAIFRGGRPMSRSHVAQVGLYSGAQAFDLYLDTRAGIGPGTGFDLEIALSIGAERVTLSSRCKRPEGAAGPAADIRSPAAPKSSAPAPAAARAAAPEDQTQPKAEGRPGRRETDSNEVPTLLRASSGGATIVSFDWVDQNEDVVGTSGRQIVPGGGKDEHFRMVMDLPAAANIEEITITGGGVQRWTTRPIAKYWPVAVFANQELKTRGQTLRVGAFSGRWTFDLYVESRPTVRSGQAFGVEVVAFIAGTRHHLTARCQRR